MTKRKSHPSAASASQARLLGVFAADIHLAASAWSQSLIRGDSYWAFQQLVRWCGEIPRERFAPPPPTLLLGGDIVDSKTPDSRTLQVLFRGLRELHAQGWRILEVRGQHDLVVPSFPTLAECVEPWADDRPLALGSRRVAGVDWQPGSDPEWMGRIPDCDILVTHQTWYDFMGSRGGRYAIADLARLGPFKDGRRGLVLTGDFHEPRELHVGNLHVVSPGSLCMQSVDEEFEKYFYLLYEDLSVERVKLPPGRPVRRCEVLTEQELDELIERHLPRLTEPGGAQLPEELRQPLLIVYHREVPGIAQALATALAGRAHLRLIAMKRAAADMPPQPVALEMVGRDTLKHCLPLVCDRSQPVFNHVLRLLDHADDPAGELRVMGKEFLEGRLTPAAPRSAPRPVARPRPPRAADIQ